MNNVKFRNIAKDILLNIQNAVNDLVGLIEQEDRAIYISKSTNLIFKVYSEVAVIKREAELLKLAKDNGVKVPEIHSFIHVDPSVLVMEYLDGDEISSEYKASGIEAGKMLESFHNIPTSPQFSNGELTWDMFIQVWLKKESTELHSLGIITKEELNRVVEYFQTYNEIFQSRPIKYLHGDLQPLHIIINRDLDTVLGIIDFADAQPGDPLMDIAVLSLWDTELAPNIISGYSSLSYTEETKTILKLYRLLRKIAEIPWLIRREFNEKARINIESIKKEINEI